MGPIYSPVEHLIKQGGAHSIGVVNADIFMVVNKYATNHLNIAMFQQSHIRFYFMQ